MKVIVDTNNRVLTSSGGAIIAPEPVEVAHPNPVISVNSGTGLITATHTQAAGAVEAGTSQATEQLSTQAAQTITPTTSDQTIEAGKFLTGAQTIKGDANLVAANIASGVTIFGVTGSHSGGSSSGTTLEFYPCVSSPNQQNLKGGNSDEIKGYGGSSEPGTHVTFYGVYPAIANNNSVPVAILIYDKNNMFYHYYYMLGAAGSSFTDGASVGVALGIISITQTIVTLKFDSGYPFQFDPSAFEVAPIYAINHNQ